jgi:hypothetical protein
LANQRADTYSSYLANKNCLVEQLNLLVTGTVAPKSSVDIRNKDIIELLEQPHAPWIRTADPWTCPGKAKSKSIEWLISENLEQSLLG